MNKDAKLISVCVCVCVCLSLCNRLIYKQICMKVIPLNTNHCTWARAIISSFCLQVLGSCTPVTTSKYYLNFLLSFRLTFHIMVQTYFIYSVHNFFYHFMNTLFNYSCLDLSQSLPTFFVSSSLERVLFLSNGKNRSLSQAFIVWYLSTFISLPYTDIFQY